MNGQTSFTMTLDHKIRYDLTFLGWAIFDFVNFTPTNFVEIGSRDGFDAEEVRKKHNIPEENCYVFEPIPDLCSVIIERFPKFKVFNNAISTKAGIQKFYVSDGNVGASSLLERCDKDDKHRQIEVECIDMETVMTQTGLDKIDLCKIDVEGATLDVLQSFGSKLKDVKVLQLELEHKKFWEGQCMYEDVAKFLADNNFVQVLFALPSLAQSDSVWVRRDCMKS